MSSFLFLIAVVAVIFLLVWFVRNDADGLAGGQRGFFAIRNRPSLPTAKPARRDWRDLRNG